MRAFIFLILSLCIVASFSPAAAEQYGLSLHSIPKQSTTAEPFAYANPDAPKGGTLRQAQIGTFDTLNPFSLKGKAAAGLELVYDRLTRRSWDEPFTLYPLIAEKIEFHEDERGLTIFLNPEARFQDGSKITSEDALFSFETLKELGRPNMRRIYRQVEEIGAKDKRVIELRLSEEAERETLMIMAMMPVLSKSWWVERDFEATLLEPPNTSGPYRITEIDPGRKITYERDPDYWARDLGPNIGHYNADRLSYSYFRDDMVALESFMKGDLDIRRESDVTRWRSAYAGARNIKKMEFPHGRPQRAEGMIFNLRRGPFEDPAVRAALVTAYDAKWAAQTLYDGALERTNSLFVNSSLSAQSRLPGDGLDRRARLRLADEILTRAGWVVEDNIRQKNGAALTFEILLSRPEQEKIALAYIETLERLGVIATIRTLDSAGFQNRLMSFDYDVVLHFWQNSLSPGTEQIQYWGCTGAVPHRLNYPGLCDEEIEAQAIALSNARTYDELREAAQALDRMVISQNLFIPLFYSPVDRIAVHEAIQLPEISSLYGPVLETWWREQGNTQE